MKEKNSRWMHGLIVGALIIALIVVGMQKSTVNITSQGEIIDKSIVSVVGQAELEVEPDQAYVMLTVETQGNIAAAAQTSNKEKTNRVLEALKREGLKDDDIETTSYYLYPDKRWDPDEGESMIIGYTQIHTMKATIDDVEKAGEIIDAAVISGVNRIGDIQFILSDDLKEDKEAEVLTLATEEARAKAESIAKSLGAEIVKVSKVSESNIGYQPYRYADYAMAEETAGSTQISPEDVTVSAAISIEYVIEE